MRSDSSNNSEVTFCYEANQRGQNNPVSRLKFIVTFPSLCALWIYFALLP